MDIQKIEKLFQLILATLITIGYWYLVHTKQASAEGFALLAGNIIQHIYHIATDKKPETNGKT
jgi:hypothetical protein